MNREEMMRKYADLLVRLGVALQKDQYLILECDAECYELARHIVHTAMERGAKDVIVHFRDAYTDKYRAQFGQAEEIKRVLPWQRQSLEYYLERGACSLALKSPYPRLLNDISAQAGEALQVFQNDLRNVIRSHWGISGTVWCIACAPNPDWAQAVYPELDRQTAYDALWNTLMDLCMVDEKSDPVENWIEFSHRYAKYSRTLNEIGVDRLHFSSANGTDFVVGFNPKAHWVGGKDKSERTPRDNAGNIPSNEVATSPDKYRLDGIVHSSRPLVYGGQIIDRFWLRFEQGRVTEYFAETGMDLLTALLNTDEGSRRIGEVAFVECDMPLAKTGRVFYNTLLDENAACHMALGNGYAVCIPGLSMTDKDAWAGENLNASAQHIDFMFGTDDMNVDAYTRSGKVVPVFRSGKFVI